MWILSITAYSAVAFNFGEFELGWKTLRSMASVTLPFFALFQNQVAVKILGLPKIHLHLQ